MRISIDGELRELQALLPEPLAIGATRRDLALQLDVGNHAPLLEVDQKHSAGLETPLVGDGLGWHGKNTNLGRHDHAVIMREVVAAWAEAVSIEHRADHGAVGESNRRRAVPGLHQTRVVLIEVPLHLRHVRVLLPGLWDHHHGGLGHRTSAHVEELENVIEGA